MRENPSQLTFLDQFNICSESRPANPYLDLTRQPIADATSRRAAARVIWNSWQRYRNKKMFHELKQLLTNSQSSLSLDVLKHINPVEARALKDPLIQPRVRFRLGGSSYPPKLLYKIYTSATIPTHYFSGTQIVHAHTDAAHDAWKLMGNTTYMNTVVADDHAIPSAGHVCMNMRQHVRYLIELDHRSIHLGGRGNAWRELCTSRLDSVLCRRFSLIKQKPCMPPKVPKRRSRFLHLQNLYAVGDKPSDFHKDPGPLPPTFPVVEDDEFQDLFSWSIGLDMNDYTF